MASGARPLRGNCKVSPRKPSTTLPPDRHGPGGFAIAAVGLRAGGAIGAGGLGAEEGAPAT